MEKGPHKEKYRKSSIKSKIEIYRLSLQLFFFAIQDSSGTSQPFSASIVVYYLPNKCSSIRRINEDSHLKPIVISCIRASWLRGTYTRILWHSKTFIHIVNTSLFREAQSLASFASPLALATQAKCITLAVQLPGKKTSVPAVPTFHVLAQMRS